MPRLNPLNTSQKPVASSKIPSPESNHHRFTTLAKAGEMRREAGVRSYISLLSTKMRASLTLMLREPWARVLPLVFSKALDTTSAHRRTLVVQADKTGSDLIYALTELRSSRGRVSRESFRHIVRNGQPACENSVARQTVFQFSNVGARRDQLGWWDIGRIQKPDVLRSTQLR